MPAPTAYTEQQLAIYMLSSIGNLGTVLELTADHFREAVNDTLLAYGDVDSIGDADDIKKLRALAKVEAWRVAVEQSSGMYNFQSHDGRYDRATIHAQALVGLGLAENAAAIYTVVDDTDNASYTVGVSRFTHAYDPYAQPIEDI